MNLNSNVNLLLGLHAQLKVFHWQTKGFARHEAFADIRLTDQIDPKDTNLLNLRDELLGAVQKLKYLLTLE